MTKSMINKANDLEDLVSANMKKASAILAAMRTLQSEECMLNDEETGNLLWAASDLIDEAIEADTNFLNEQKDKNVLIGYQQIPAKGHEIKAVK